MSGRDRLALSLTAGHRWYGLDPYATYYGLSGNWDHPVGDRSQLRVDASALKEDNAVNRLQDADRYTAAVSFDRAFSETTGGGVRLFASRDDARDPGYANTSGGGSVYVYREWARTTIVANAAYRRLESDARLFLYPERREDDNLDLSLSGDVPQPDGGQLRPARAGALRAQLVDRRNLRLRPVLGRVRGGFRVLTGRIARG